MEERDINVSGAIVFWNAGPTQRELLEHKLTELGLERFTPRVRTDAATLKSAMGEYCETQLGQGKGSPDRRIEGHRKQQDHGFEVVEIDRGEDENQYNTTFSAKVENGNVQITRGYADVFVLQELYRKAKWIVTGPGVGKAMVDLLAHLGGTALRPSGGVYWIPEHAVETWAKVAAAVESCADVSSKNRVYLVRTVMDHGTVKAVRDAIVAEVEFAATTMADELQTGLGEDAIETRKKMAAKLHQRIKDYEEILGAGLERLHIIVSTVEDVMTVTALQSL